MAKTSQGAQRPRWLPLLLCIALTFALLPSVPATAALDPQDEDSFRLLASELVVDLDRFAMERGEDSLAVAVWPHAVGEVPVPPRLANEINDRLLAALLSEGGHRHRLVARDALRAVVSDLEESSDLNRNLDPVLSALAESAKADILVVCKLRDLGDGQLRLSYRAVNIEDGSIVSATSHRDMFVDSAEMRAMAMPLEQALINAAAALEDDMGEIEVLHLQGIQFEDSGRETPFGRYVEGRLADALAASHENAVTGETFSLRYSGPVKGVGTGEGPGLSLAPGSYRLAGNYWDFGEVIELRLSLQDHEGPTVVWRERIQAESLPNALRRHPLDAVAVVREEPRPIEVVTPKSEATPKPLTVRQPPRRTQSAPMHLVVTVQRDLQLLGYRPGPVDGLIGPQTKKAVRSYQRDHGLPVDGRVTFPLADHLFASSRRTIGQPVPTEAANARPPAGFLPPPGYCRVWFEQWPAHLQPPLAPCDHFAGAVPVGSRLIVGAQVWPSSRAAAEDSRQLARR